MIENFPQFVVPSEADVKHSWQNGIFVFDTNVLLNLYRYQLQTSEQLLGVLEKISDRVWIPHYVALEFYRNRLNVISEQNRRFIDVKCAVNDAKSNLKKELEKLQLETRHSLINPEIILDGLDKLIEQFNIKLTDLEKLQQQLTDDDPLQHRIEQLFRDKVGKPPNNQNSIDDIYKIAEKRFNCKIPPGYKDTNKGNQDVDEFYSQGIIYRRKFGDFLIWRQILDYVIESNISHLILVIDDEKEDWWNIVECNGKKTIGPRIELIDEAKLVGALHVFQMYTSKRFLQLSNEYLNAKISDSTINEVRDLSEDRNRIVLEFIKTKHKSQQAVKNWLKRKFDNVLYNGADFPDLIVEDQDHKIGLEVKYITDVSKQRLHALIRRISNKIEKSFHEYDFTEFTLILVTDKTLISEVDPEMIPDSSLKNLGGDVNVIFGYIYEDTESKPLFRPEIVLRYNDRA